MRKKARLNICTTQAELKDKATEPSAGGTAGHITDASQVGFPCGGQCGRDVSSSAKKTENSPKERFKTIVFVPVVDKNNNPLMPTTPSRARRWIKTKKATWFWKKGVYCVRLNTEPSDRKFQEIVISVDPSSKKEGFTVKSSLHTYLNTQADAVHVQNPLKGNIRKFYGGTMSMGYKRGSLVVHPKYGLSFIGGTSKGRISLHNVKNGSRLTQNANPSEIKFLTYNSFITFKPTT